jgi:hypothetical protein
MLEDFTVHIIQLFVSMLPNSSHINLLLISSSLITSIRMLELSCEIIEGEDILGNFL